MAAPLTMRSFFLPALAALTGLSMMFPSSASAQRQDLDTFYRPVQSTDLFVKLPPRFDDRTGLEAERSLQTPSFFSGSGGCPDEINIGSVTGDTSVFGSVDIEVFLDSDVTIICE